MRIAVYISMTASCRTFEPGKCVEIKAYNKYSREWRYKMYVSTHFVILPRSLNKHRVIKSMVVNFGYREKDEMISVQDNYSYGQADILM